MILRNELCLTTLRGPALYRLMSASCGAAFMLYGYDTGVLGGIQTRPECRDAIVNPEGPWAIPIIASIFSLAAAVMSLVIAVYGMHLGRRWTILSRADNKPQPCITPVGKKPPWLTRLTRMKRHLLDLEAADSV